MKRLSLYWLLLLCLLFALVLVIYYETPLKDFTHGVENEEVVTSQDIKGLPVEGELTIEDSKEEENKFVVEEEMLSPVPVGENISEEIEGGSGMPSVGLKETEKGNKEGDKVNTDEKTSSEPREGVLGVEVYKVLIFIIIVVFVIYWIPMFLPLLVLILTILSVFWVSYIGFEEERCIYRLGCDSSRIRRRKAESYRFLTQGWIHGNRMHLYGNMREFFIAGCGCIYTLAELFKAGNNHIPSISFSVALQVSFLLLFTYVVGIILGGVYPYLVYDDEDIIMLGSSVGVAAIWGFFLMLRFPSWQSETLRFSFLCIYPAFLVILISLDVSQAIKNKIEDDQSAEYLVAYQEHVAGSIWGAIMAIIVRNYATGFRQKFNPYSEILIIVFIFWWIVYPLLIRLIAKV